MQTHKVARSMGKFMDLRMCLLVGGSSMGSQFEDLSNNPDVYAPCRCRSMAGCRLCWAMCAACAARAMCCAPCALLPACIPLPDASPFSSLLLIVSPCFRRIIATPGRLMHHLIEVGFSLKSVVFCCFDEADR
jgi:hypothetical protein